MQLIPAADGPDADVVGLEVAVGDTLLLQILDDLQQVLAEPLEQIDVQPALLPQPLAERLRPGRPQEQAWLTADRERLDVLDDVLMPQLGQHFALLANP